MNNDLRKKISSFTDLKVWQEGHRLVILVYKITKKFPKEETYSLLKNHVLIAKDVGYLKNDEFQLLVLQANVVHQLFHGLIKKSKTFINHKS